MLRTTLARAHREPPKRFAWAAVFALIMAAAAHGQLRVVSYNTATGDPDVADTARPGMEVVLASIGEELRSGIAKPIDVLLLQEQHSLGVSTQSFVDLLNGIYGAGTYARGNLSGLTSHPEGLGGRPSIVYNTHAVELIAENRFGPVSGSAQARSTMRYRLRPVGYNSTADFYVYNSHYKAGDTSDDRNRREIEATSIRGNPTYGSDVLGEGAHVIYAGDHNFYTSAEAAFQTLAAAGHGQAFDAINRVGSWSNNSSFADVHTQSPCASSCGSLTSGGMDDRFDFQLLTGEFLDGEGLSYISGSYRAFGNNGTTYNANINAASNTYPFNGVTSHTDSQILNALKAVTDHLPVVVDYQLPAVMNVVTDTPPITLNQGDTFNLDVTVSNAANVLVALGADELDYSLTTAGDLFGSFLNQTDLALGGGNLHLVGLDTSTPGMKSGVITVMSTSQAVQNGLINIPISFEVLAIGGLDGDYNENGVVDAADYTVWQDNLGSDASLPNDDTPGVAQDDFERWQTNFGTEAGSGATGSASAVIAAVPEPAASILLLLGVCLTSLRRSKLRAWTPRP